MSRTLFLIYGSIISLLFSYASFTGWNVLDFSGVGRRAPGSSAATHYHK